MKKYLFGLFAIALAVAFTAFTTERRSVETSIPHSEFTATPLYYEYDGTGSQAIFSNFINPTTLKPVDGICPSTGKVCWIKVLDKDNDNDIDNADFQATLLQYDADDDFDLNDQAEPAYSADTYQVRS